MFSQIHSTVKTSVLFASQCMVPGEPIFVLLQDDGTDGKESICVTTASLSWVRDQMDQMERDPNLKLPWHQVYVLLPERNDFVACHIAVYDSEVPGEGRRLAAAQYLTPDRLYPLWSCEL
jgi:hypothetical protein